MEELGPDDLGANSRAPELPGVDDQAAAGEPVDTDPGPFPAADGPGQLDRPEVVLALFE